MDEGEEAGSEFIITDRNPAELLELEEELFHKMAFLVKPPIDIPRIGFAIPGRDAEICVVVSNKLLQCPSAIGLISKDGRAFQGNPAEQFFCDDDIVNVAGGQHDLNRVPQSVHNGVNLRASAAAADSDALIGLRLVLTDSFLLGGAVLAAYGFCEPPLSAP